MCLTSSLWSDWRLTVNTKFTLQEFIDWLKEAKGSRDGVVLVCHEPTRKVLVPLLLEALYKYNLVIISFTISKLFNVLAD